MPSNHDYAAEIASLRSSIPDIATARSVTRDARQANCIIAMTLISQGWATHVIHRLTATRQPNSDVSKSIASSRAHVSEDHYSWELLEVSVDEQREKRSEVDLVFKNLHEKVAKQLAKIFPQLKV